jgi:poly(3-hydroxybutyrate) depolymerase
MTLIHRFWLSGFLLLLLALPLARAAADQASPLGAYNADIKETSISGISSGAFMAVQFGTAWSSVIKGVGVIAGGPFYCAQGRAFDLAFGLGGVLQATGPCMKNDPPLALAPLLEAADEYARRGDIDPLDNLRNQKVYLFSGYNDSVVAPTVGGVARAFYLHYMGDDHRGNVFRQDAIGAGHSQVTLTSGGACATNGGDFINNCSYDQAGILLQHMLGRLHPRASQAAVNRLKPFDQSEFTKPFRPVDYSLSDTGYIYVPQACEQQRCRVHIALHGCRQTAELIGDHYVRQAGYNEWAETNHLIVVYPQTRVSQISPFNPNACWDWWGYTNSFYATRNSLGRQIGAIKGMLDRVTSKVQPPHAEPVANDPAPKNLAAIDHSATAIALAWSPVAGAQAYNVYRSTEGEAFALAGRTVSASFGDSGLRPATTYRYKAAAILNGADGPTSAVVSETTRSNPPVCDKPGECLTVP